MWKTTVASQIAFSPAVRITPLWRNIHIFRVLKAVLGSGLEKGSHCRVDLAPHRWHMARVCKIEEIKNIKQEILERIHSA